MKITPVSVFLVVFSVCMIMLILSQIKRETIGLRSALVWLCLMTGIGFFSLFPNSLNWIIRFSQMEERILFVLLAAVFVLLAFVFNLSTKYDRMQRNWAKTVQELALLTYRIDKKEKEEAGKKTEAPDA